MVLQVLQDPVHFIISPFVLSDNLDIASEFFSLIPGELIQVQAQLLGQVLMLRCQIHRQWAEV